MKDVLRPIGIPVTSSNVGGEVCRKHLVFQCMRLQRLTNTRVVFAILDKGAQDLEDLIAKEADHLIAFAECTLILGALTGVLFGRIGPKVNGDFEVDMQFGGCYDAIRFDDGIMKRPCDKTLDKGRVVS